MKLEEQIFVIEILPGLVGWVIGRAGARIKELQNRSSRKIWVDQDVLDDQPRKLFFQGTSASIEFAVAEVKVLIGDAPLLRGRFDTAKGITCNIVECPADLVGLLIGKRGWTIKKIQSESGAQVAINQSIRSGLPRKVIVSGTQGSVHHALQLIEGILLSQGRRAEISRSPEFSPTEVASNLMEVCGVPTSDITRIFGAVTGIFTGCKKLMFCDWPSVCLTFHMCRQQVNNRIVFYTRSSATPRRISGKCDMFRVSIMGQR